MNQPVTDDDLRKYPEAVKAAVLAELVRWCDNTAFQRKLRKDAHNILASRYVLTWKRQSDGSYVIKCRLCVKGFQDIYKSEVDRYSGTSSRWGQRAVVATAIQSGWPLASLDISMAFLKGLSFDEIQSIRGGPKRTVCMQLPRGRLGLEPSGVSLLRSVKGYENFNDALEVLEMVKGGFGLVDAPNLFTTRVDNIFKEHMIKATLADQKMYLFHVKSILQMMISAHMDDFKATGSMDMLKWLHSLLAKAFGADVKMEIETSFIHTGITHTVDMKAGLAILDQNAYISAVRPVSTPELNAMKDTDWLGEFLAACFLTLLGAVAWMNQTRMEMIIYVSALQRHSKKPRALHLRRLNRVVRHMQKHPQGLEYRKLPMPVSMIGVGDSAFKAPGGSSSPDDEDQTDALVVRAYIIALGHFDRSRNTWLLQILDFVSSKQKHVCKGVWAGELHNQCDTFDHASILRSFFEEVRHGCLNADELRRRQDAGTMGLPLEIMTDSYSIFSYLKAAHLKYPADKSTYFHLAHLFAAVQEHRINKFTWIDTRDMLVDAMTKGKLDRGTLIKAMRGSWHLEHKNESIGG